MIEISKKTLAKAIDSGAFEKFAKDSKLPVETRRRIKRIRKQIWPIYEEIQEDQKMLAETYGVPHPDDTSGTQFQFPDREKRKEFDAELKKLMAETVTIEGDVFYDLPDLKKKVGDPDDVLSGADEDDLDWLIIEGSKPEPEPEQPTPSTNDESA